MRASVLAALLCLLTSCGLPMRVRLMFGGELPVQVEISPEANFNSPVAVDLMVVYDPKVLDELLALSASAWFAKRTQFLADRGGAVRSQVREWVPGQVVQPFFLHYRPGARRVVLFARYDTAGDHRATVDPQQPFRLVLGEKDFSVEAPQ